MSGKGETMSGEMVSGRRLSRRNAFGMGSALAASALVTPRLSRARQATPAARGYVADAIAALDEIVNDLMARSGVPGVAIGVVHQDEVVHLAGYGVRELGKPEPIDPDTVFQLASVSKGMAATTVAAVVGDGEASWDDVVHELDPAFELFDPWITHQATVRDLFSHRSGLPGHAGDLHEDLGFSRDEVIERLRYFDPAGPFRASYNYTNFGLSAAAFAVAKAAGEEWDDIAESRFYAPLGMTSTSSRFADYIARENRAIPHSWIEEGVFAFGEQRQPDSQTPAGGVSSSVRDMTQYLRLLLGNGTVDGESVIDATALGETFLPHAPTRRVDNPAIQPTGFYGLGWNVNVGGDGQMRFNHSGAFALGAATVASFIPSQQLGIVVLSNGSPIGMVETISLIFLDLATTGDVVVDYYPILREIFAEEMKLPYDRGIDFDAVPADFTEARSLETYTGQYASDLWGSAEVVEENGGLVIQLGPNLTPYAMTHFRGDQFHFLPPGENAGVPSLVTFTLGPDGLADRLTIDYLNQTGQGELHRVVATG